MTRLRPLGAPPPLSPTLAEVSADSEPHSPVRADEHDGETMTDEELAGRFWDEQRQPSLRRDGIPDDALASMRKRYIADACANPEAVRQLREMYR